MSDRDTPDERQALSDFSTPEDADFTTPGEPIVDDDKDTDGPGEATPGNPLTKED